MKATCGSSPVSFNANAPQAAKNVGKPKLHKTTKPLATFTNMLSSDIVPVPFLSDEETIGFFVIIWI
jgi:hypothetical protein